MMERKIATSPIAVPRTTRRDEWRGLTSARAGQIVPVAYFPLLREDAIRGRVSVQVRMAEAVAVIINPIRVTMQAHLIPKSALARFDGSLETLNRSYAGENLPGGGAAPAWFLPDGTVAAQGDDDKGHEVYDKLGIHYKSTTAFNSDLLESYNVMVNWRRASVSQALPKRLATESKLAPAFWNSWKFDAIKPSFDAAMMEGTVPVSVDAQTRIIKTSTVTGQPGTTPGLEVSPTNLNIRVDSQQRAFVVDADGTRGWLSLITPQMGGSISLANIRMATQTMAFAKMRERYQGVPDEYLIDLLMRGIRVPPEDFREPILIGMASSVIGQTERYATDGASLETSVANGMAQLSLTLNTPAVGTGGIVLVTMEIVPEQLYERNQDTFMYAQQVDQLPDYVRDYLDPQKVEVVANKFVDVFHETPDGVFGYAPMNHSWQRSLARVGGRFKRPVPDAFVEDRQRVWSVEKANPTLSADFYMCPDPFPHDPFADKAADPFEVIVVGQAAISGLTQFGAGFEEDGDHYEKIMADVDEGRISSVPVAYGGNVSQPVAPAPVPEAGDETDEGAE